MDLSPFGMFSNRVATRRASNSYVLVSIKIVWVFSILAWSESCLFHRVMFGSCFICKLCVSSLLLVVVVFFVHLYSSRFDLPVVFMGLLCLGIFHLKQSMSSPIAETKLWSRSGKPFGIFCDFAKLKKHTGNVFFSSLYLDTNKKKRDKLFPLNLLEVGIGLSLTRSNYNSAQWPL